MKLQGFFFSCALHASELEKFAEEFILSPTPPAAHGE